MKKKKGKKWRIAETRYGVTWKEENVVKEGDFTAGISTEQVGSTGPADFISRKRVLFVFVTEQNRVCVLRYCPRKDVCAILSCCQNTGQEHC